MIVLPRLTLVCYDTSLGSGRLSGDWVPDIRQEIRTYPEAKGPIDVFCMGHGGWTSVDLLNGAGAVAALNPTHIFTEFGAINDCPDFGSGPAVSRATHNANNQAMVNLWRARNPDVDITVMTMSSVSVNQTARGALADYYADELATAQAMGCRVMDNYSGVPGGPVGGWPKPLLEALTNRTVPFVLTPASGYTDQGTNAALWNPADEYGVTVSADGLTATGNSSSAPGVRGTTAISGKVHFEVTLGADGTSGFPAIGVANAAFPFTSGGYLGQDGNSIAWNANGFVAYRNGAISHPTFATTAGTVIAVEIDADAKTAIFRQGANTTGPLDISGISGPLYPAVSLTTGMSVSANFSQSPDGLHPLKPPVDIYLKPNVIAALRARAAAFWP